MVRLQVLTLAVGLINVVTAVVWTVADPWRVDAQWGAVAADEFFFLDPQLIKVRAVGVVWIQSTGAQLLSCHNGHNHESTAEGGGGSGRGGEVGVGGVWGGWLDVKVLMIVVRIHSNHGMSIYELRCCSRLLELTAVLFIRGISAVDDLVTPGWAGYTAAVFTRPLWRATSDILGRELAFQKEQSI